MAPSGFSQGHAAVQWQSRLVLLLVLPSAAVWMSVLLLRIHPLAAAIPMLGAGATLALLVWLARAATPGGALTGGVLMACFCFTTPGWHSSAWPVMLTLALTLGATRVGRAQKARLGTAESRRGRDAAQVAANLGVASLAGTLANVHGQQIALVVLLAALAEATADTVASELGQVLGGTPRLITTWKAVQPGTDGGVTITGTAVGALGAVVVTAAGVLVLGLPRAAVGVGAGAGVIGLLLDSVLGATVERAGWLNNDAVNFLSTLGAALAALAASETVR